MASGIWGQTHFLVHILYTLLNSAYEKQNRSTHFFEIRHPRTLGVYFLGWSISEMESSELAHTSSTKSCSHPTTILLMVHSPRYVSHTALSVTLLLTNGSPPLSCAGRGAKTRSLGPLLHLQNKNICRRGCLQNSNGAS